MEKTKVVIFFAIFTVGGIVCYFLFGRQGNKQLSKNAKMQKHKNTKLQKNTKYKNTKIQKYKNTKHCWQNSLPFSFWATGE